MSVNAQEKAHCLARTDAVPTDAYALDKQKRYPGTWTKNTNAFEGFLGISNSQTQPSKEFEKEFFSLAAVWLACRYEVMWGSQAFGNPHFDIRMAMLGERDYEGEMKLLCQQRARKISHG